MQKYIIYNRISNNALLCCSDHSKAAVTPPESPLGGAGTQQKWPLKATWCRG